jgi:hypothetical protein
LIYTGRATAVTPDHTSQTKSVNPHGDKQITTAYYDTVAEGSKPIVGKDGDTDSKRGSNVPAYDAHRKPSATPTTGTVGTQKQATSHQAASDIANKMSTVQKTAATDNKKGWLTFSCTSFSEISDI